MKVGIVGNEAAKFTRQTELAVRQYIGTILRHHSATHVVSGGCHLGGVDIWAEEEAAKLYLQKLIFLPTTRQWSGGYKERNIRIAVNSDVLYNIVVDSYPPDYTGMRFKACYHCNTDKHVKSGGCWTMTYARKIGKPAHLIVVPQL